MLATWAASFIHFGFNELVDAYTNLDRLGEAQIVLLRCERRDLMFTAPQRARVHCRYQLFGLELD